MDATLLLVIIIAAVLIAAVAAWLVFRSQSTVRTRRLRKTFGPEYDAALRNHGDKRRAEQALNDRIMRVRRMGIRTLSGPEASQFANEWTALQHRFVDEPVGALHGAEELLCQVLRARKYHVGSFEERVADLSVHYPEMIPTYRFAHDTAIASEQGQASTEQMRKALMGYRAVFGEVLENRRHHVALQEGQRS